MLFVIVHALPPPAQAQRMADRIKQCDEVVTAILLVGFDCAKMDCLSYGITKTPAYERLHPALRLWHPQAAVAPVKLFELHTHGDPPGISGVLLEGRFYYDCFVLANKSGAIYSSATA